MRVTAVSSVIALVFIPGLAVAPSAEGAGCTLGLPAGIESRLLQRSRLLRSLRSWGPQRPTLACLRPSISGTAHSA